MSRARTETGRALIAQYGVRPESALARSVCAIEDEAAVGTVSLPFTREALIEALHQLGVHCWGVDALNEPFFRAQHERDADAMLHSMGLQEPVR